MNAATAPKQQQHEVSFVPLSDLSLLLRQLSLIRQMVLKTATVSTSIRTTYALMTRFEKNRQSDKPGASAGIPVATQ